jgi:hypothetical protein
MRNMQEDFDRSVAGLAEQGFQRAFWNSRCITISPKDGTRCAIGHMCSKDGDYRILLFRSKIQDEWYQIMKQYGGLVNSPYTLLSHSFSRSMLAAHDNAVSPDDMIKRLRNVAERFDLILPEVLR